MLMQARSPQDGELMPDHQLIDEILTLIVAGHETTASTLNWCWYLLSQHPEVERKLADELDALQSTPLTSNFGDLARFVYTKDVLEETMRLYPAGWVLTRKALHDDRLGEYHVPAGTEVYIPPYFIQRHPALWENPDGFDPDRFRNQKQTERQRLGMIPFSVGPRNCIGAHFARIEMQIHLMTIASTLRLRHRQSQPIELDAGVNLRSKYDFIMYPEAKTPPRSASNPA
jgi:cytochrome P450